MNIHFIGCAAIAFTLAGCAGNAKMESKEVLSTMAPMQYAIHLAKKSTYSSKPELIETGAFNDESESFRHLQIHWAEPAGYGGTTAAESAKYILEPLQRYCLAHNGQWTLVGRTGGRCNGEAPFHVYLAAYSETPTQQIVTGKTWLWLMMDVFEPKGSMPALDKNAIPAPRSKQDRQLNSRLFDVEKEYSLQPIATRSNAVNILGRPNTQPIQFTAYVKRNYSAEKFARQQRDEEQALLRQDAMEAQARQKADAVFALKRIGKIGAQVCRVYETITTRGGRSGLVTDQVPSRMMVMGHVEQIAEDRIRILVGGVKNLSGGRSVSFNDNGTQIAQGVMLWDIPNSWSQCS